MSIPGITATASTPIRIALLRGFWLNGFEMQNYAPLQRPGSGFDLHAWATEDHLYDLSSVSLPVTVLKTPRRAPGMRVPLLRRAVGAELRALGHHDYWKQDMDRIAAESDVLHAAELTSGYSYQAACAARRHGRRLALTVWENIPFLYQEDPLIHRRTETVREVTDLYLAITERAGAALRVQGIESDRIRIIGCGVDQTHFRPLPPSPSLRRQLDLRDTDFVVLCAAQLLVSKGLFELLSAVALIQSWASGVLGEGRHLRVLLVGKGADEGRLRERCSRLGLDNIVSFAGSFPYEGMPELHNLADLFVLPSVPTVTWQEQFGMVLAESMACGKPVLTTLSGSIPDVVGDAALSVQPADPMALADGLRRMIGNDAFRREMSERSLRHARTAFDAETVAERLAECYREMSRLPARSSQNVGRK